jgi:hypothetical protein
MMNDGNLLVSATFARAQDMGEGLLRVGEEDEQGGGGEQETNALVSGARTLFTARTIYNSRWEPHDAALPIALF